MASIPPLEKFIAEGENQADKWTKYKRAFGYYAASVGIVQTEDKRDFLLHIGGQDLQEIYETFVFPCGSDGEPPNPSFEDTVSKLDAYFDPKRNVIYERFEFASIVWAEGDTTDSFITKLKQGAMHCEFPDKEDRIRDQFVYKCKSVNLKKRFLREPTLTLESLSVIARAYETSNRQSSKMAMGHEVSECINQVSGLNFYRKDQDAKTRCMRCGRVGHFARQCENTKGKICAKCGLEGHFAVCCRTKEENYRKGERNSKYEKQQVLKDKKINKSVMNKVHIVSQAECQSTSDSSDNDYVFVLSDEASYKVDVLLNSVKVSFIVDTGATVNVISEEIWLKVKKHCVLQATEARVFAYGTENPLKVLGQCCIPIQCNTIKTNVLFIIVTGKYQCLLGKKVSQQLNLVEFPKLKHVVNTVQKESISVLVENYNNLFKGIGKLKNFEAKVVLKEGASPILQRMRRFPYHLRAKIKKEIDRLQEVGIIEKVTGDTKWLTPLMVVPKKDGTVRLCLDMRKPNQIINKYKYPIPLVEDLLQEFEGAEFFSELDVNEGFHQLSLSEQSREITTFNTEDGMFRYTRVIYGMCTAPEIFQEAVEGLIKNCKGTRNMSDNIVVFGKTYDEHFTRLKKVLQTLADNHITLNFKKCYFGVKKLDFMGYVISRYGICLGKDKVQHILEAREPKDMSEVRSFLGLVNFCSKFLPNVAHITAPLRKLTRKNTTWSWGQEQKQAFTTLKEAIASITELTYFNIKNETVLFVDAGPEGLGAVLTQIQPDKKCKPVAFASKALSDTEKAYSQTEKEALACIWACEHFHNYVYGSEFTIITDHKPLEIIYSPNSRPSARIERWVIRLQQYKYCIKYRKGELNIADPFSRLLNSKLKRPCTTFMRKRTEEYLSLITQEAIPKALTEEVIRESTEKDEQLKLVKEALRTGRWVDSVREYKRFRNELTVHKDIVLRNNRIVIPSTLRRQVLAIAHETHLGMVRMKAVAVAILRRRHRRPSLLRKK